ncbi:MAG: DUF2497 domain-containing protein [Janthinobacterium lividum]
MTYPESQSQQEFNDILSSIREKILEEEVEGSNLSTKDSDTADQAHSEVLDLTRLVQEDGSVVDLPSKVETPSLASEKNEAHFEGAEILPELTDFKSEPFLPSLKQEDNMHPNEEFDVNTFDHQTNKSDEDRAVSSVTASQPQVQSPSVKNFSNFVADANQASFEENNFLSDHTLQESAAAFAALSRVKENRISQTEMAPPTAATVANYTVDDLMRELLRPLLKEWLDAHLPSLVKSLVLEQIEKVLQQPKTEKAA